jgi:hypothetical protein
MTSVKQGERYHAVAFKSGSSSNGDWELVRVSDERGKNDVTIFPANVPSGAYEDCDFVVKDIVEVKVGFKQNKKTQKWEQATTVVAVIEAIKSDINLDIDDGELPWDIPLDDDIGLPL